MQMKLEKMGDFFNARLNGYEEHQLTAIEKAREFYPATAACLPARPDARILDLGCGTGLELGYYFERNPTAQITGIDRPVSVVASRSMEQIHYRIAFGCVGFAGVRQNHVHRDVFLHCVTVHVPPFDGCAMKRQKQTDEKKAEYKCGFPP